MSSVIVVAPIIIANWPAIAAAVAAGVGTLGFSVINTAELQSAMSENVTREEIEVENSEILDSAAGTGEQMVVEKDGIKATFTRDARGALKICMEGKGKSKTELRQMGEALMGRVTQQYAYHRVVTELKQRNMTIVEEGMTETESVKIRIRNW
ncbi:DUF1257 domain-containing protein [Gimesia sp.]|uniref:DUF1257 domain-containing protein n=1 Tax=Gimesia sp. TaxID=2024833 RepID=UPI000C38264D|nr:DUF1257 domain-containing protein [Gimesia sp.]MAX40107.1 hypothetical protein [Gimesia sp.]HBL44611.1 hypothetical protein [Planctomycetaceae bacterium]|tara:strand:- start:7214 stop:7672 length:459 start_codon:yes stop_codon:yes gene_type:complete